MIEVELRSNSYHFLSDATSYVVSKIASLGLTVAVEFRLRPRISRDIDTIFSSGASSLILATDGVTFVSAGLNNEVKSETLVDADVLITMRAGVEEFTSEVVKDDASGNYELLRAMLEEATAYLKSS
ncbi:MAG: hypothetical protein M0019_10390 [Actinomycetota bacterium]|nr:hypothetical protein [Actinomycetota bacterium]